MDVLIWIALGLALGVIVNLATRSRSSGECVCLPLATILGAVLGGWIGAGLTVGPISTIHSRWPGFAMALLGGVALLLVYRVAIRRNQLMLINKTESTGTRKAA